MYNSHAQHLIAIHSDHDFLTWYFHLIEELKAAHSFPTNHLNATHNMLHRPVPHHFESAMSKFSQPPP
jgi:hypothetical protein